MTVSELPYLLGPGLWFQQRHAEKRENWPELFWYLPWVFCQAPHLFCHPGADPFWMMPLEAETLELEGSPVLQDLQWGHCLWGDASHGCASCFPSWNALVGTKNRANSRRFSQHSSQSSAGFSKPVGVGSKELGNQSSVTFMGTLTNLCAWDLTTISKNISKYSFALIYFGKSYSCCHLTWKQHMCNSGSSTLWHLAMLLLSLDIWTSDWNGNKGGTNEWPNFSKLSQIFVSRGGDILQVAGVSIKYWILHSPFGLIINVVFVFKLGWPFSSLFFRVIPLKGSQMLNLDRTF